PKEVLFDEWRGQGVRSAGLAVQVSKGFHPSALVCHVVSDRPPRTRRERAEQVKKHDVFTKYSAPARAVLGALLDKYANEGLVPVEDLGVLRVQPFSDLGTPIELVKAFGGRDGYLAAVRELERALYDPAA